MDSAIAVLDKICSGQVRIIGSRALEFSCGHLSGHSGDIIQIIGTDGEIAVGAVNAGDASLQPSQFVDAGAKGGEAAAWASEQDTAILHRVASEKPAVIFLPQRQTAGRVAGDENGFHQPFA